MSGVRRKQLMENSNPIPAPRSNDSEQLDLLVIFHYVIAGLGALFACFPLIHVGFGIMMISSPESINQGASSDPQPTAIIGYIFAIMGALFILLGWTVAIATFISGRYIRLRKKRMFSFVNAALLCIFFPLGTVLGVFTLIVLCRESVERIYQHQK
jgi:hypothetical protein